MKTYITSLLLFICSTLLAQSKGDLALANDRVKIIWQKTGSGWQIKTMSVRKGQGWVNVERPTGEHTLLFAADKPNEKPDSTFKTITGVDFPEPNYKYQLAQWAESTNPVSLNTAGVAYYFLPNIASRISKGTIRFQENTEVGTVITDYSFDPNFPTDILVKQTLTAKRPGYFSLASPTLAPVNESNLSWATVPGYFQGNKMEKNFAKAYAYGHGVPDLPVVYRERCASTLCPMVTSKNGITFSVIPEPGLARDPWAKDKTTQTDWNIGLSHKNRRSQLSPTLYYPILGEPKSALKAGDVISYNFRYSISDGGWFKTLNHAVYDIYKFKDGLQLRESKQSLTSRIEQMHEYLVDPATSLWNVEEFKNLKIGAQSYLGGVVGSNKDAMKNSDYGAMWMLASATKDPKLTEQRLPYALNFKLVQQQTDEGFFKGAAVGQYYLAKSKKFVEEWGEVVEPIGLTYYTMLDIGNVLLFEPNNQALKERLRLGAETLLKWQKKDGSWAVAYDRHSEQELFKDVKDVRPTFYGMLVAYQILKDAKYLNAAKKGADWVIENSVKTGNFLGVCGDARYAPDFATGQSAQALLDLFEMTGIEKYKQAAIVAAKIYTTSIYTHPIPNKIIKNVNGVQREDWEIAQSGLSFEHGGIFGSANRAGPIMLASHAGLFIRMYKLTNEKIFADMARSAAVGRDAFVEPKSSVASYYWNAMNRGSGPYPHHAWWQVGWITDYLMAEAEMRSNGQISFPRGFVTPKVGPHQTYGFKPGKIFNDVAQLSTTENFVSCDKPQVDYIVANSNKGNKAFVVLLNNQSQPVNAKLSWGQKGSAYKKITVKDNKGNVVSTSTVQGETTVPLESYGLKVLVME
ncbi:MAG: glycerophosphoryl diester phosphodiesterase [Segetibacter sp.]|nr:glycerophosphoryl diester phosphodiesterase [Segetibacter sp.]